MNNEIFLKGFVMTVCLAAINRKRNSVIFASDRMITTNQPPIEFEHNIPKVVEVNEYCIALSAGSALRSKGLFDNVKRQIKNKKLLTAEIAEIVKSIYQQTRVRLAEDLFLKSRGLNLKIYMEQGGKFLRPELYQMIDKQIATLDFQLVLILAGVDETGPSIYGIFNPGWFECYDTVGFHAIGSGAMHAIGSLINSYDPNSDQKMAFYSVFTAKKDAERAPGVGKLTDFGLITLEEKIKYFPADDEIVKEFDDLHEKEKKARTNLTKTIESGNMIEKE